MERTNDLMYFFCRDKQWAYLEKYLDQAVHKTFKKGEAIIPRGAVVQHLYYCQG